ncbi:MAG: hypothetical protein LBT17_03900, partial [Mycoplasmataceae bacterium]|nr:hypothetical protein [Mycoplasmataceae bacterium]
FLIWFLKDILEFQDIYIPWILIVFTGVFITCIILTIVISKCAYTEKIYIGTFVVSIIYCILLIGLPVGILFLCDATKRRHYSGMKSIIPISISSALAVLFLSASIYAEIMPTPWQQYNVNDETGGEY